MHIIRSVQEYNTNVTLKINVFSWLCVYNIIHFVGKAESRQRAIEKSRSFNSHAEHTARGVRRHGRLAGTGVERRERHTPEEELPVTPERRIPPVRNVQNFLINR